MSVLQEPVVQSYILYSSILALKLLMMAILTGMIRTKKNIYSSEEDAKMHKGKVKYDDPDIERVRRAHLNDLENIPAFWILGALYLTTDPFSGLATLLFRMYTLSRIVHTVVYAVIPFPQPTRAIAYMISFLIKFYMGVQVVLYYIGSL